MGKKGKGGGKPQKKSGKSSSKRVKTAKKGVKGGFSGKNVVKKGFLPSKINVGGIWFNTPPALRALKHNGADVESRLKILVYAIKRNTGTNKTLSQILSGIHRVRDNYAYIGEKPPSGSFDYTLFRALRIDDGYYPRTEVLNKVIAVHESYGVRMFRYSAFDRRMVKYFGFHFTMANAENELNLFWEARDKYIQEVDAGSLVFSVYFFYEYYSNFCLVDFDNIQIDGGDEEAFKKILRDLIKENDYARY